MTIIKISNDSRWKIVSSSIVVDPKFAVKELIDNAVDAGAANIYIDVDARTCGCDYICVRDDGLGVPLKDRESLCLNHATSKISSFNDLNQLSTLGFRGEALFSVATLSNQKGSMEITTRTKNDSVGEKWSVNELGEIKNNKRSKVPCPVGTVIVLRRLLAGLRSRCIQVSSKALKNIEEFKTMINHYSLNLRDVRFHFSLVRLENNGKISEKRLQMSTVTNITRERALSLIAHLRKPSSLNFIIKEDLEATNLVRLDIILPKTNAECDVVNVKKPKKFFSVNSRVMSLKQGIGKALNKKISDIYRQLQLLEPTVWFINLKCSMEIIDINIEPGKDDVLIKNMNFVMEQVSKVLLSCISLELGIQRQAIDNIDSEGYIQDEPDEPDEAFIEELRASQNMQNLMCTENGAKVVGTRQDVYQSEKIPIARTKHESISNDTIKELNSELISSKEAERQAIFYKESPTKSQASKGYDSTKSSSLSYNDNNSKSLNEDQKIDRDVHDPNPFPTSKLGRDRHSNIRENGLHETIDLDKMPSIPSSILIRENTTQHNKKRTIDETFSSNGLTKTRRLTGNEESKLLSLQSKPISPRRSSDFNDSTSDNSAEMLSARHNKIERHLSMFSEYTNSFITSIKCDGSIQFQHWEEELPAVNQIKAPSVKLVEAIEVVLNRIIDKETQLTKTKEGWHLLVK
ncbi:hypothetical protein HG535_0D00770 [Zygotorulaspora mrakii]|uniref:DNA mismatch repair protein S5 domain-containing protein n=1 Tax=Zygotorulaspora mrakii TaxID=42260 RepID=A0A7H9B168_ZYGMR|nr:uncharacterized protein HG535_0D00770 [Zygotorulaspora mrakii]QLG72370.1 hypothetical protein HG535_0D00770 [Zygotorulaspora mrakii]